jgi:hypothetical protein
MRKQYRLPRHRTSTPPQQCLEWVSNSNACARGEYSHTAMSSVVLNIGIWANASGIYTEDDLVTILLQFVCLSKHNNSVLPVPHQDVLLLEGLSLTRVDLLGVK